MFSTTSPLEGAKKMDNSTESLRSGILAFLKRNNRSGFTESQIISAFFGSTESASEEDRSSVQSVLEILVGEKSVLKSTLSTKSGIKTYYKSP